MRCPPLLKYELFNVMRGKWLIAYTLLFAVFLQAMLLLGGDASKAVASMMSVVLLVVPMVSVLYASVDWYNSEGFTTLLLTQPVQRAHLYLSRWCAISICLSVSFLLGTGVPLMLASVLEGPSLFLLVAGVLLTFIFVAIGLLIGVLVPDRMKGLGITFLVWFYFALVHDGLVFALLSTFHEYPLEIPAMIITGLNPVDLARIVLLMALDFSALMGYTGTVLQKALSSPSGYTMIATALGFWLCVPVAVGTWLFRKRDL